MEKENHLFKRPAFCKIPNLLWEEHSGHNPVKAFQCVRFERTGRTLLDQGLGISHQLLVSLSCWPSNTYTHSYLPRISNFSFDSRNNTSWLQKQPVLLPGKRAAATPRGRSCIRRAPGSSQELIKGLLINTPTRFAQLTPVRKPFTHCLQLWSLWAEHFKNPFVLINTSYTIAIYFLHTESSVKEKKIKNKKRMQFPRREKFRDKIAAMIYI